MKKRINLFIKTRKEVVSPRTKQQILTFGTVFAAVIFVAFLIATFLQFQVNNEKNALLAEKQQILEFTLKNKDIVGKMSYFSNKSDQLQTFLKDDAQFLPYYNLLKEALTFQSSAEFTPVLESLVIDKYKHTDFTVRFDSYEPAYAFFKYMESETFLENFNELTLVGFSLNNTGAGESKGYQLQFKGKFKPIN